MSDAATPTAREDQARWKNGTPIHGSLREAISIWLLMIATCGFGIFIGWAVWHG